MRTLLLALLLLPACNSAADRLIGKWAFDKATYELIQRYRELPPDEQAEWVATAKMDLIITAEEIRWEQHLPTWGTRSARGPYTVAGTEGNRVTIDATLEGKKQRFVFTVEENRLRFGLGGRSIILRRRG